jgi:hypothetical protein
VGSSFSSSNCKDSATPVPCGDGTCRSDYITCLRALSDVERRDSLRSSVLWAFRAYAGGRAGERGEEGGGGGDGDGDGDGDGEGGDARDDALLPPPDAGDAYMRALFGAGDRTAGTAARVAGGGERGAPPAAEKKRAGGAKLGASSDVSQWEGGALEYTDSGVVAQKPRARGRAN